MSEKEGQPDNSAEMTAQNVVPEQPKQEGARPEISGVAIARMMGVATGTEMKLLEGKLDLIASRVNNLTLRIDRIVSQFGNMPTGTDLERIDVQIGSLKSLIRDLTMIIAGEPSNAQKQSAKAQATEIITAEKGNEGESSKV